MLALLAGFLYAFSAILCKKALELNAGTLRTLVYNNVFMSLCFLPYYFLAKENLSLIFNLYGILLGFIFFISQMLCFLSLRKGDASLMTPVMGSKPIFVALFVAFLNLSAEPLGLNTWLAVGIAAIAIALIGWPTSGSSFSAIGLCLAISGAAGFGLLDSLVPYFTFQSDPFGLLFVIFVSVGIFSLFLIPWTERPFFAFQAKADKWIFLSAIPMGVQAIFMSLAIGFYEVPTQANVFYASRGLWSVTMVALLGRWIGLEEGQSSKNLLFRRFLGALLLLSSLLLITGE